MLESKLPLLWLLRIIKEQENTGSLLELHKTVYKLQNERGFKFGYDFVRYSFGPYSKDLENDLMLLAQVGLVVIESRERGTHVRLSNKGLALLSSLDSSRTNTTK
ncbi:MAG: hypothetical protein LM561_02480 [Desulfurococcaceae archaeon]|jgi:uncharacterized protein YwgA|nr:hypothetical protein [Desulfurococcaceae archaeon]